MATRTVPILTCRELDEVQRFYLALGFELTYRQDRPYPCLGLEREDVGLQFGAIADFEPENSYASVILVVPDSARLFAEFSAGLRREYGKLPVAGIPRITRPRRKQGTSGGFTVVDPGGNWIRIAVAPDDPSEALTDAGVLDRVLRNAARQADARGDEARAVEILRAGLQRHPDAPVADQVPVRVFLAELLVRTGDLPAAEVEGRGIRALVAGTTLTDPLLEQIEILDQLGLDPGSIA